MKKIDENIEDLLELDFNEKTFLSAGSEFSDWTWEKIGQGLHHLYNRIKTPAPEHIW